MKKLILPLLVVGIILSGCQNGSQTGHSGKDSEPSNHHDHSQHAGMATASASATSTADFLSEMSLYNLPSRWSTQNGDSIQLKSLKGKIRIVAMVYTNCDYACPRILADLKRIEESIPDFKTKDIGMVLVTLDPERDTPEKLKEYARKNRLDSTSWLSLTGEETDIMELAALLNVRYRKELSMDIAHSNIISVLDKEGELIHQQEGLGTDPDETVRIITNLVKSI